MPKPPAGHLIRWGKECARTGPWPADGSIAFLVPVPDGARLSAEFVRRCTGLLAQEGYGRVVTAALPPSEQGGFVEAGFGVQEHLHLLMLDSNVPVPPVPPGPALHRAGRRRRDGVLEVDRASFAPFWQLDRDGLRDAMEATQRRRLRVVLGVGRKVVGYAICGVSERRGFVQRLAVLPEAQGQGIGKRLLVDGLHWLRSQNAHQIVVNTQLGNETALALYRKVGFRDEPSGLDVLAASLSRP